MEIKAQTILVVSPHTDDAELACGGSIARWVAEGRDVKILHLSDTGNIFGSDHAAQIRQEALSAAAVLGVQNGAVEFGDFPTRYFLQFRQEILDLLIETKKSFRPNLVVGPGLVDSHQDHFAVAREINRAFKDISVLHFDTYWNMTHQDVTVVVEISTVDLEKKIQALGEYKSQSNRPYMRDGIAEAQAKIRGLPRGLDLAEAFSVSTLTLSL